MKKQLLLFVMILLPMVANADAVEINGVYYNLITKGGSNDAEVTSNPNKYTGTVVIPESVTCDNTNYNVTSIGNSAFYGCSALLSVNIPNSVTNIGDNAFYGCSILTSVNIPNNVINIGDYAFKNCSSLPSISIPNSVTSIRNYTFQGCSNLTSIVIPNGVKSIGLAAFSQCSGLTSVAIPNSVTSIGGSAFNGCSGLPSITIPNSVTSIGNNAFDNCSSLNSVTIPNGITKIEERTFRRCSSLTSINIPNSVTKIGEYAFEFCSSLISIVIPSSLTKIEGWVFHGCSSLTTISIPNSVKLIDYGAFYGCSSLNSVTIGSGINTLGHEVFASCPELKDVYCYAINVPYTQLDVFRDSYIEHASLHVPAESVNAYKTADPWKNFKNIVSLAGGDVPEPSKCATPSINYTNGKLMFNCETEGAECQYTISDNDIMSGSGNEVQLTVTYNISVYATKSGYDNSETATATLCWIDKEPTTEGITDGVAQIPSKAVLIQSEGGILKVEGIDEGTQVAVYTPDGKQAGSAICRNGAALVGTSIQPGNTAIVKIGEKSVKVIVK